jgi:hypothetical protein
MSRLRFHRCGLQALRGLDMFHWERRRTLEAGVSELGGVPDLTDERVGDPTG